MFGKTISVKVLSGLCLTALLVACMAKNQDAQDITPPEKKPDSIIHVQISSVGDLMCHNTQSGYARISPDSFDFNPSFEFIKKYLQQADLMLGNLETTLGGRSIPYSGYPRFNSPDAYAVAVANAGFDFLATANNHSNDTDEKGILRTIRILDSLGLGHTGTYTSQADRDSIRICNVNGIHIAILAYTFSTNGIDITPGKNWLVNYCDSALIKNDISAARSEGAELVITFFHFGEEYQRSPSAYQESFANWAISCGSDIILGSHPHVIEPATFFRTQKATLDSGFLAYSMGNFISNQKDNYTDEGIILNMFLSKNLNTGKIKLDSVTYVPTWVYRGINSERKMHIVFPVLNYEQYSNLPFISNVEMQEMKFAQAHTATIMSKMTDKITPAEQ